MESSALNEALNKLLRGTGDDLGAYLEEVHTHIPVPETKAIAHCHLIKLDGNGRPRVADLATFIALRILDYSIPRSQIVKAKEKDSSNNSTVEVMKLQKKALQLFTSLQKTGEGGEMLLYALIQDVLKIPQLLCKMPLKTNADLHYHGADGIHVGYDKSANMLDLYWGESKLYASVDTGITECFKSLKTFFEQNGGSDSRQERDLQLVTDNLDLVDQDLQNALLQYFNKDDEKFTQLRFKGVTLIGFDSGEYPDMKIQKTLEELKAQIQAEFTKWNAKLSKKIKKHKPLESFDLHVFLIPFPSVENFRKSFLTELGLQ
jgi:hypothetical protein